jgi:hypothetical protein
MIRHALGDKIVELGLDAAFAANRVHDQLAWLQGHINQVDPRPTDAEMHALQQEHSESREAFTVLSSVVGMTLGPNSLVRDDLQYPSIG